MPSFIKANGNTAGAAPGAAIPNAAADTNENNNSDSSSEGQDTSDDDDGDVMDLDDPPYQAPPIIEAVVEDVDESSDSSDEDDNDDLESGDAESSESTRLSSTGSGEDEDQYFDDDHEDLIALMDYGSDVENDESGSDSATSSQGIDR